MKLKPCPFCGASVYIVDTGDNFLVWQDVEEVAINKCCVCFAIPRGARVQTMNDAVKAWNKRV